MTSVLQMNCCISFHREHLDLVPPPEQCQNLGSGTRPENRRSTVESKAAVTTRRVPLEEKAKYSIKTGDYKCRVIWREESRKQWGEANMTERVWPPHSFAAPSVVDHRRSPPPFLFLFHQHIISGVNRPTLCSSSQLTDGRRCGAFHVRNGGHPTVQGREERLCRGSAQSRAVGGQMTV